MSATAEQLQGTGTVVEQLRERIRQLQAAPRSYVAVLRTGVEAFDEVLPAGGLPLGQAVELCGEAASGRTSLALRAVAAAHRERRLCAYVDGAGELYPPAAAAMGVDLERLLIVRPKAAEQRVWAAVQLARSGAFACVVLDLTRGPLAEAGRGAGARLAPAEARKLADAAVKGGGLLLLLTSPEAPADGVLRLRTEARGVEGLAVEVVRSRQGATGRQALVPWGALYPALQGARRLEVEATPAEVPEVEGLYRGRGWGVRNGCGILGQRPGRDARAPSMRERLGAAAG